MKTSTRYITLAIILVAVVGSIFALEYGRIDTATILQEASIENIDERVDKNMMYTKAKEIVRPSGYINTEPIEVMDFIGKEVILIDFMTYTCINCQRTYPYLNAWYDKYNDEGLQIIAMHTPEFDFEKDIENVRDAAVRFGLKMPIVLDNDYATWRAYGNRYWPRKYLIDIDGYIVYDHIGEGSYDETEMKIKELLKERAEKLDIAYEFDNEIVDPEGVQIVEGKRKSPETYFGSLRNNLLKVDTDPEKPKLSQLYLVGDWNIEGEYAETASVTSKVIFKYQAEKVFFVASADEEVEVVVLRDGEEINKFTVKEEKLYTVLENPEGHGTYTLEFAANKPGLKVYAFTFG